MVLGLSIVLNTLRNVCVLGNHGNKRALRRGENFSWLLRRHFRCPHPDFAALPQTKDFSCLKQITDLCYFSKTVGCKLHVFDSDEKPVLNKSVWKNESENMEIRSQDQELLCQHAAVTNLSSVCGLSLMFTQMAKGVAVMHQEKGFMVSFENTPHPIDSRLYQKEQVISPLKEDSHWQSLTHLARKNSSNI